MLIIGMGEVGKAHYNVLSKVYDVCHKDKDKKIYCNGKSSTRKQFDTLLIATQCNPADMQPFYEMVCGYAKQFRPKIIDVLTTTPCGTVECIAEMLPGIKLSKSSVRGMHPNLDKFLLDIPKHIGGAANVTLRDLYTKAGITCVLHNKSRTVELAHVLNNFLYGVNVMATDEAAKYCREFGVDWMEILEYRKTNNSGFVKAGFPSKVSPILYPSSNHIGGHCVTYAPTTIPKEMRGQLATMLANYNK